MSGVGCQVVATLASFLCLATFTGVSGSASGSNPPLDAGQVAVASTILPKAPSPGELPRYSSVSTKNNVIFITIDDGNTKNAQALSLVQRQRIPVTVFLTNDSVRGDWSYFKKITAYGGSVQNHTMTHRSLPGVRDLDYEICRAQRIYQRHFGYAPTMLRPPYGNGGYDSDSRATRLRISKAARACGIRQIVMWDVVVGDGSVEFARGSLKRGDIVLLHFKPGLASDLRRVLGMARAKGFRVAPLATYLR